MPPARFLPIGRIIRHSAMLVLSAILAAPFVAPIARADSGPAVDLAPRYLRPKPEHTRLWPGLRQDLLVVKFAEGSRVRLRSQRFVSETGAEVEPANDVLAGRSDLTLERLFMRPESILDQERLRAQDLSGRALADLNDYYTVKLANPSAADVVALLDALNALDVVEIAYAEPIPRLASLTHQEVVAGRRARGLPDGPPRARDAHPELGRAPGGAAALVTPDFVSLQDYLEPAPLGVDAFAGWTYAGGRGDGVKIIDVEIGWNWSHEDLKTPFYSTGPVEYSDHGVAVTGEIMGQENGFGITGIAPDVEIGSNSVLETTTADIFNQVAAALDPGDIFVIELHCPGPEATGVGQQGYIALEYWQANFDAIATATARGVICCAAAGNGEVDFDDPIYGGLFDRDVRDSGAILVGAAVGTTRVPEWFTNTGSRVDLHGWGSNVVTTGYGDLYGSSLNQYYTDGFSGTSSATPIVVGSVASLQGAYKALSGGAPLPPGTITEILRATGTPQASGGHIGPRPDLAAAIPALSTMLATLDGTVSDPSLDAPLEGAVVRVAETGARTTAAADGTYSLLLADGTWTVIASRFGSRPDTASVLVTGGGTATQDFVLTAITTRSLRGRVRDGDGYPIAGATVEVLDTPLAPVTTDAVGLYEIPGIPVGFSGVVLATSSGMTPDEGAFTMSFTGRTVNLWLAAPEDFETSGGGFTVSGGQWAVGVPAYGDGPSAHSGTRCWGTNLTGPYDVGLSHILDTPAYDLAGLTNPRARFWHWYAIWGPYDGANISISTNGGASWSVIQPVEGYPDDCIDALPGTGCSPGFTNASGGWVPCVLDLAPYAGQSVRFRFRLEPWDYTDDAGWYLDDFAVYGDETAATGVAETPPEVLRFSLLPAQPNPMRGGTTVRYALPASAEVSLRVYDTTGRLVRVLEEGTEPAGLHQSVWNARNEGGAEVAPGIYFLRLTAREGDTTRVRDQRLVVVR
jgi:serine protease